MKIFGREVVDAPLMERRCERWRLKFPEVSRDVMPSTACWFSVLGCPTTKLLQESQNLRTLLRHHRNWQTANKQRRMPLLTSYTRPEFDTQLLTACLTMRKRSRGRKSRQEHPTAYQVMLRGSNEEATPQRCKTGQQTLAGHPQTHPQHTHPADHCHSTTIH